MMWQKHSGKKTRHVSKCVTGKVCFSFFRSRSLSLLKWKVKTKNIKYRHFDCTTLDFGRWLHFQLENFWRKFLRHGVGTEPVTANVCVCFRAAVKCFSRSRLCFVRKISALPSTEKNRKKNKSVETLFACMWYIFVARVARWHSSPPNASQFSDKNDKQTSPSWLPVLALARPWTWTMSSGKREPIAVEFAQIRHFVFISMYTTKRSQN